MDHPRTRPGPVAPVVPGHSTLLPLGIDEVMLNVQWKEETGTLFIYAPVGSVHDVADAPALYRRLLEANCLGADTAGFTLGILAGMETIVLSGQLVVQTLTVEQLTDFLTLFVEQAEIWNTSIREGSSSECNDMIVPESFEGTMLRI